MPPPEHPTFDRGRNLQKKVQQYMISPRIPQCFACITSTACCVTCSWSLIAGTPLARTANASRSLPACMCATNTEFGHELATQIHKTQEFEGNTQETLQKECVVAVVNSNCCMLTLTSNSQEYKNLKPRERKRALTEVRGNNKSSKLDCRCCLIQMQKNCCSIGCSHQQTCLANGRNTTPQHTLTSL